MAEFTVNHGFCITQKYNFPLGSNIQEIAKKVFGFTDGVIAFVKSPAGSPQEWEHVPSHMWKWIRPKGDNCIKFHVNPAGSRGNIFQIIAVVLIAVGAPFLGATAAGALGFTAGTFAFNLAASAISAAIAIGATALVNSLFAPSQGSLAGVQQADQQEASLANVDSDQNLLAKGARLMKVLGERRVVPHDICYPHRYLRNGQEVITRVLALEGEHTVSDIRLGETSIDNIPTDQKEVQVTSGLPEQPNQSIISVVTKPTNIQEQLSKFVLEANDNRLASQTEPEASEPKPITFSPGYHPDMSELTVRLGLSPFVFIGSSASPVDVAQLFRVSFWKKSDPATVHRLPEVVIRGRKAAESLKELRFRWDSNFGAATSSTDFDFSFVPDVPASSRALSNGATGAQWSADAHFKSGSSEANIFATGDGINIVLDEAIYPKEEYEFQIHASYPVVSTQFNAGAYTLNGVVESLYYAYDNSGVWQAPAGQGDVSAGLSIQFATLVVDRKPCERPGVKEIAIRLKNVDARNINMIAASHVYDWSGAAWDVFGPNSNPGTLTYNLYKDWLDLFRVSSSLINSTQLVAWRQECIDRDRTASFVASGQPLPELIDHMCTAGFATKRIDTGYSVVFHADRSSELPEMTFSHRDSKISLRRPFPETPKGIRASFKDRTNEWKDADVVYNNRYGLTPFGENEQVSYPSIDRPEKIAERVDFDLLQMKYRPYMWLVETGPAGHHLPKGAKVGVVTDLLSDRCHGFFVREVLSERLIALDRSVPAVSQADITSISDLTTVEDILISGEISLAHMVTKEGVKQFSVSDFNEDILELNEDIVVTDPAGIEALIGTRLTIAARDDLFHQCFVFDNQRANDMTASLQLVPEATIINEELLRYHHG